MMNRFMLRIVVRREMNARSKIRAIGSLALRREMNARVFVARNAHAGEGENCLRMEIIKTPEQFFQ